VPVKGRHELLDAEAHTIHETQLLRDIFLIPKRQPVLLAAGAQVQKIADAPEHLAGVLELTDLARQKGPCSHVVLLISGPPTSPRCPFGHVQVPQTAAPLLHIRLEKIEAASETTVARPGVLPERTEEVDSVRLEDLLPRAPLEIVEQCATASDGPESDQRRGGSNVLTSQAQHLVDASYGMPDVHAQIPQRVEQALGQRTDEGVVRVVAQEYDVHVAIQAQGQPAVASDRNQRDTPPRLATKGSTRGVRRAVQGAQQTVEGPRMGVCGDDTRVSTAHRVLERSAVSTEVPAAGLAERRCEPT